MPAVNTDRSNARPVVLVTALALAKPAVAMLEDAGYAVIHTTGYPEKSELIRAITEHRPVAILQRQGLIDGAVLDAGGSELLIVARHGAGYDGIDVPAATARDITVTRAAGANSRAVAEHSFALLLSMLKDIPSIGEGMAAGLWEKTARHTADVEGLTLGIVGYGAIGSKMARYAEAFGMTVLAYDPYLPDTDLPGPGTRVASLPVLLAASDVLTLHCPLSPETRHLIGPAELAMLPRGARIVNAARGGIVDEAALLMALDAGQIAAAALDVFATEPLPPHAALRVNKKVIATPHIAANTPNGAVAMATGAANCIISVLDGCEPRLAGAILTLSSRTPIAGFRPGTMR